MLPDFAMVKQKASSSLQRDYSVRFCFWCSTTLTFVFQVMMGGAWFHRICGFLGAVTEQALLSRATEAVHAHLHISAAPVWSHVRIQKVEPSQCCNVVSLL